MSMRETGGNEGGDERKSMKIGRDSKKSNGWKSLKEMKEYLRSKFEKKAESWERDRNGGETYLYFAAYLGDVDATKRLIQDNADVRAVSKSKESALHYAALKEHVDVAKVLLRNGAEVNAVNENKWTALHNAASYGHVDVAKMLIQNGADVNAVQKTN